MYVGGLKIKRGGQVRGGDAGALSYDDDDDDTTARLQVLHHGPPLGRILLLSANKLSSLLLLLPSCRRVDILYISYRIKTIEKKKKNR